jgi:hypothetical protein
MKKPGKGLTTMKDMENLYAAEAQIAAKAAPAPEGVPRISANDQQFRIGDNELPDPLNVIVVAETLLNVWYEEEYDPDSPSPPSCFALHEAVEGADALMTADPTSPNIQGGPEHRCAGCEMNAFGSAEKGRGKACANTRQLCVVMADDPAFGDGQELRYAVLGLSPTALTPWGKFVSALNKIEHRPPHGVITSFSFNRKDPVQQKRKAVIPLGYKLITDIGMASKVRALRASLLESKILLRPLPVIAKDAPERKAKRAPAKGKRAPAKAAPAKAKGGARRATF